MQEGTRESCLTIDGLLVIVGGGQVELDLLKSLHARGAVFVGADGGAETCAATNIVPTVIIGDLDSLKNRNEWEAKTRVVELAEQETTDFEKCLYSTDAAMTVCLGMSGKRLDHTLAALDVLARYSGERHLAMVSETDLVLAVRGRFEFEVAEGARVSVHPFGPIEFEKSEGLEFSLKGVKLAPGVRSGCSNRALLAPFEIVPKDNQNAPYLVIMEKQYLDVWLEGVTS